MDYIRKVDYYKVMVPDKPGEGAKVLAALKEAGVNLLAFSGFPRKGKGQLDFIPEDPAAFKAAARKAGLKLSPRKSCFLIQGEDRPGAVAEILSKLAEAKVNVITIDAASDGEGCYSAILWVDARAMAKAAKALGAS